MKCTSGFLAIVAALPSALAVQFTNSNFTVTAGESFTLTWTDADGPVTITLKDGLSTNLVNVEVLATGQTGTSYTWTPDATLPSDTYAFQIDDDSGTPNYSSQFEYQGSTSASGGTSAASSTMASSTLSSVVSSSASSAATSSASSASSSGASSAASSGASSTASSAASSGTSGSSSSTDSSSSTTNTASGSSASATVSSSTRDTSSTSGSDSSSAAATDSEPSSTGTPVSTNDSKKLGSPLALVLGGLISLMVLN